MGRSIDELMVERKAIITTIMEGLLANLEAFHFAPLPVDKAKIIHEVCLRTAQQVGCDMKDIAEIVENVHVGLEERGVGHRNSIIPGVGTISPSILHQLGR